MYQRKSYQQLLDWKQTSNGSTAMLIEGARRIGKSTLAKEFAANASKQFSMPSLDNYRSTKRKSPIRKLKKAADLAIL